MLHVVLMGVAVAGLAAAQTSPPPASPAPAAPAPAAAPSPASRTVQSVRNKISAGDLPSAESILEVHREQFGEDGFYLEALGWVARGALLTQDYASAQRLVTDLRALCAKRIAAGARLDKDDSLETALGAAIEVEAQLTDRVKGKLDAARYLESELAQIPGPVALRVRVYKRKNMLTLVGTAAPELVIEDFVGDPPPRLSAFQGRPVLLFVWRQSCGDCRAQCASLSRIKAKYAERGLQVVALTRYYEDDHVREKAVADSVWKDAYRTMGKVPSVISTASMERYGGSSTPTFVFIDGRGVVRGYTPTRLTEAALDRAVAALFR
jgi:thiol-disulfide isomerase/thioredoxin